MTALQALALALVAIGGTAACLVRDPLRQAIVTGAYGLWLAVLFLIFQAPDVALSQLVVGGLAVPVMTLLALAKIRGGAE